MNYFNKLDITILNSIFSVEFQNDAKSFYNARSKIVKRYTPRGKAYKETRKLMYAKKPISFKVFLDNGGFGEVLGSSSGAKTENIELCANSGCGFNENNKCTSSGTQCFGYMEV